MLHHLIAIGFAHVFWHFAISIPEKTMWKVLRALLIPGTAALVLGEIRPILLGGILGVELAAFAVQKLLPIRKSVAAFLFFEALIHLGFWACIYGLWMASKPLPGPIEVPIHWVMILTGAIWCVFPMGIVVGLGTSRFLSQLDESQCRGLTDAGKIIGQLERGLIFVLILSGNAASVGFLIAAKSILRFPELKGSGGNRKESEYIIIGTMMSFLAAIAVALLTQALMKKL